MSSGPKSGSSRAGEGGAAGPVNQRSPVPDSFTPTSTPLRATAVTRAEPSTPAAASSATFAESIATLRKNWWLPRMNAETSAGSSRSASWRRRVPACVRWWHSSPASSAARWSSIEVQRAAAHERGGERRAEHVAHPLQPRHDLGVVGAVAQDLSRALVEVAPGLGAASPRRGRPSRASSRSRCRSSAPRRRRRGWAAARPRRPRPSASASAGVAPTPSRHSATPSAARIGGHIAATAIGGPAWQAPPAARWGTTSRAGSTSSSSGRASARRATASSAYNDVYIGPDPRAASHRGAWPGGRRRGHESGTGWPVRRLGGPG